MRSLNLLDKKAIAIFRQIITMLEFIRRYQLQKNGLNMPKQLNVLQRMLAPKCGINEHLHLYKIIPGDTRGRYFVSNEHQYYDDLQSFAVIPTRGLDSAISTIYRLISKNHPELIKIKFDLIEDTVNKFPKKHRVIVREIIYELCLIDSNFAEYGLFIPGKEDDEHKEHFAILGFDGVGVYDYLSYQRDYLEAGIKLQEYLSLYFDWDYLNNWSMSLDLKYRIYKR